MAVIEKPSEATQSPAIVLDDGDSGERIISTPLAEAIHKALLESTSELVFLWGIGRGGTPSTILEANAAGCLALGYTREELLALSPLDVIPPEDFRDAAAALVEFASKGELLVERALLTKAGSKLLVEAHGSLLEVGGELTALVVCRDLTGRSDAERALREEHSRAQRYLDIAGVMIVALDLEGNVTLANRKACDVLGYPESELLGMNWFESFLPEWTLERRPTVESWLQTRGNDEARSPGSSLITRSGEERTILWRNTELMDECGNVVGILGSGTDVTERTRVEDALAESELMNRSLLEGSPICTKIIGRDRKMSYMSAAGINALGICDVEPYYEQTYPPDFYPESIRATLEHKLTLALAGEPCTVDAPVHDADGNELWFHTTFVPVLNEEGEVKHVIAASVDINERRRAEEALREITRILTQAELIAGAGSWERDLRTNAMTWSESMFPLFGLEPQKPTYELVRSLIHPEDVDRWEHYFGEAVRQRSGPFSIEFRALRRDGAVVWLLVVADVITGDDGEAIRLVGMTRDITERKKSERELLDAHSEIRRHNAALSAINRMLRQSANCESIADIAQVCLSVAEEVTESRYGFVAQVNEEGTLDTLAMSEMGWEQCRIASVDTSCLTGMEIRGIWGAAQTSDHGILVDDPASHPESVGVPEGHPPIDAFLGVPIRHKDFTGMIAVANREGGYSDGDRETLEALALAFAEDVSGKRAELALRRSERSLRDALAEIGHLKELLEAENVYLREAMRSSPQHGVVVADGTAMRAVMGQAGRVAQTSSTVLITGETGTGKELLARAIHEGSPRRERPFVVVNCAAMPEALVESELFGREKGAYTGAISKQIGRFEVADGSTIFLDEIGELPLGTQAKLLRVLEQGQMERLGSTKTIEVDVRVIVATNKDLERAIADGSFREDLFYRLNVFPIHIPPLRERVEDIPALIGVFVAEFSLRMGKRIDDVPQECIEDLMEYPWPGNIRELRNLVERAMIGSHGPSLWIELPKGAVVVQSDRTAARKLNDVEREHIISVLKSVGWRVRGKAGAAELLDLKPSTLESRMKKLGIKRPG